MKRKTAAMLVSMALALLLAVPALAADQSIDGGIVTVHGVQSVSDTQYVVPADIYLGKPEKTVDAKLYVLDSTAKVVFDDSTKPEAICWVNDTCVQEGGKWVYGESISSGPRSPVNWGEEGAARVYTFRAEGSYVLLYDPAPTQYHDSDGGGVAISDSAQYVILQVGGTAPADQPSQPSQPEGLQVEARSAAVTVDGGAQTLGAYMIADNNYFKLRDIACLLNGTAKQFEVTWDNGARAIRLTTGQPYTVQAGDNGPLPKGQQTAVPNQSAIYLDGQPVTLTAYNIGGNNYFKLRDVLQAIDCGVTWDSATNTVQILTDQGYTA